MRRYINNIGTRAECSPAIGGVAGMIILTILIYHFRHPIELAFVITALCLLAALVVYAAVSVTVAYRRHVRSVAIQAAPEPMHTSVVAASPAVSETPVAIPAPDDESRMTAEADMLADESVGLMMSPTGEIIQASAE